MTKRLTVSVSDEIYEKMQKWKDSLNFSGIFQEAIKGKIQRKENYENFQQKTKGGIDMDKLAERLRKQKEQSNENYFEKGKKYGYEYSQCLDYDDFQYALQYKTTLTAMSEEQYIDYNPFYDENESELKAHMREQFEKDPLMNWEDPEARHALPNDYYCNWEEGFIEGITEFWDEVKDKI